MTSSGYIRQAAANISSGLIINADDFNAEYNQIQAAFDGTAGHDHSGGTGLGQKIGLTSAVTGILPSANGGTGSAYFAISGPTVLRTYTLPDANATLLTTSSLLSPINGGTGVANNSASTITITGSFPLGLTLSASTSITLPTTGTLVNTAGLGATGTWGINISGSSASTTGNAATVTTNANLTGPVTSVGNATSIAAGVVTNTMLAGSITSSKLVLSDITSLSGLTTASSLVSIGTISSGTWAGTTIAVNHGGTGLTTLTANNVILGNGTSSPTFVAPSTSGNVLTSNGTTWTSAAAPATGIKGVSYQVVDSTDIALNTTPTETNIGSTVAMVIPTKGVIDLTFFGELIAASGQNFLVLGIRIGSTNYWPTSTAGGTTEYSLSATTTGAETDVISSYGSQTQPGAFYNERVGLSIEKLSIPTGAQTVQIIGSKYSATGMTIKGAVSSTIININIFDHT